MFNYNLTCIDPQTGNSVSITKNDIDHMDDYLDMLLQFTKAVGYTYVGKITAISDDTKKEWYSF